MLYTILILVVVIGIGAVIVLNLPSFGKVPSGKRLARIEQSLFTTVIFQREGLSDLIGRECGVERHIHIFQRLGIWNEDGNSTPSAGDIITFN